MLQVLHSTFNFVVKLILFSTNFEPSEQLPLCTQLQMQTVGAAVIAIQPFFSKKFSVSASSSPSLSPLAKAYGLCACRAQSHPFVPSKARQANNLQCNARQGKAMQGNTMQCKAGQGKADQEQQSNRGRVQVHALAQTDRRKNEEIFNFSLLVIICQLDDLPLFLSCPTRRSLLLSPPRYNVFVHLHQWLGRCSTVQPMVSIIASSGVSMHSMHCILHFV